MEVREKRVKEDNSYMFKRFASHHPTLLTLRLLRIGLGAWRNYSTYFNALRSERWASLYSI